ncbi:class I SAM-dependent methyltransferase [Haloarchaeobius sp. HRN-SO-5]|uniref:class I SAM-dependent methyltransferase n=1 Tax=Haloarchaeobius sp. HRN-SO-5 TaxID=3446118 RepID=UPI003EBEB2C6
MAEREHPPEETVLQTDVEQGTRGLYDRERAIVERHFTDRDGRVLDLGCGSGRATAGLAEYGFDVVGVDRCEESVATAEDRHPDLTFEVDNATNLDFPPESFDYVLFAGGGMDEIRPESDRARATLEAWRVLKQGGVFAFDSDNIVDRFLFDPTSRDDWASLRRFVGRNRGGHRVTSRYAWVERDGGLDFRYAIDPHSQRRRLEDVGFDVVDVVQRSETRFRPVTFEPRPYYVVRKGPDQERTPERRTRSGYLEERH